MSVDGVITWARLFGAGRVVELWSSDAPPPARGQRGVVPICWPGSLADAPLHLPLEMLALGVADVRIAPDADDAGLTPPVSSSGARCLPWWVGNWASRSPAKRSATYCRPTRCRRCNVARCSGSEAALRSQPSPPGNPTCLRPTINACAPRCACSQAISPSWRCPTTHPAQACNSQQPAARRRDNACRRAHKGRYSLRTQALPARSTSMCPCATGVAAASSFAISGRSPSRLPRLGVPSSTANPRCSSPSPRAPASAAEWHSIRRLMRRCARCARCVGPTRLARRSRLKPSSGCDGCGNNKARWRSVKP